MYLKDLFEIICREKKVTSDQFFIYNAEGKKIEFRKLKSKPKIDQRLMPQFLPIIFYFSRESAMLVHISFSKRIQKFFCQVIEKAQIAQVKAAEASTSPSVISKIKKICDKRLSKMLVDSGTHEPVPEWFSSDGKLFYF